MDAGDRLDSKSNRVRILGTDLPALIIYVFINTLFVWKYSTDYAGFSWMPLLYLVAIIFFLRLISRHYNLEGLRRESWRTIYAVAVLLIAVGLTFLMLRFDPQNINVGRYPALHDWISRLLAGQFPYGSDINPSGMPFLFILAMPFYLLGDLGLFQIFAFLIFAALVYRQSGGDLAASLRIIVLLVISPIFLFEIVVRSDLFSNMVVVLLYISILEWFSGRQKIWNIIFLGIVGGLILSTRGVVLLIYLVLFLYLIRQKHTRYYILLPSMLAAFILTLLPFMLWNYGQFMESGPLAIQSSYIPVWAFIMAIVTSLVCGVTVRTIRGVYMAVYLTLFGIISIAFLGSIMEFGAVQSVLGDRFDISYFSFCLPFLLVSLINRYGSERSEVSEAPA
jgi:hypothetical protein